MAAIVSAKIPSFTEAMLAPLDYELCYSMLGWTLAFIGENCAVLITEEQAQSFVAKHKEAAK